MLINELLWTLFIMAIAGCFGWTWRDYLADKEAQREHDAHMGMYADPSLVYWFRLRDAETDPYWRRMPLREYARKKASHRLRDAETDPSWRRMPLWEPARKKDSQEDKP